ncbi:hypothetical protein [Trueperella bialowiezensis]|uniref:DUF4439 domain-containing protein n=1 Tax=Trueperella bialowiezensis TaxID=312285 RepID=A0A448PCK7_9ACTO|nr:hypothetical protein [Trueperella bialowiezensis]VEI12664.1 Uncharacterised protein [Trueperella bialowiezensis]
MSKRESGSTLVFAGSLLLGVAIFALVMVVMGTRLDKDVSPEPASEQENERQEIAALAQVISDDAELGDYGQAWLDALGGVWVPWPDGAPEGYTNPPTPVPAATDAPAALDQLASTALNSDLGSTVTSMGVAALTLNAHDVAGCGEYDMAALGTMTATGTAVERIETARQWLELDAARTPEGERENDVARIELLSDLIDAQLAAGAPDKRPAIITEPEPDTHVTAAYDTVVTELLSHARTAQPTDVHNAASFICHLYKIPGAPAISPLPGLAVD